METYNQYYISLDTQNGSQLDDSQANFSWYLDRALRPGSKIELCQFNFSTTSATGFSGLGVNGVLLDSPNLGVRSKSFCSKTNSKPVQASLLACIPNETIFNPDASEKLVGTHEPYNPLTLELNPGQEIFEIELRLKDPDSLSSLTLDDDLDWSVLLKITEPQ
tara:strand:+ start:387 stop:875 length:489 start_codon:yes stop_codon:yes gene_type:complete